MLRKFVNFIWIAPLALYSCGNNTSKETEKEPVKTVNNFLHPAPSLEVDGETVNSPSETPMTLVQEHVYESEDKKILKVKFSFDDAGMGMATVVHPDLGEIQLKQTDEASSKYPEYKNESNTSLKVNDGSITFINNNTSTNYTIQK